MANNFDSNFTAKLAKGFLSAFEAERVLSKNVNTQKLEGKFDPSTGTTTYFKRPTDYVTTRTADGNVSSGTASSIITGKAVGTVQNYFTCFVDYNEADEALKMDELDGLLRPMATRMKNDLEVDFANFMMKNCGLRSGTPGYFVNTWEEVAEAGAHLQAVGVPMDAPWYFAVNPYTQRKLAATQRSLGAGGSAGGMVSAAHEKAIITRNFAGFDAVLTATTLATYTTPSAADRAGTIVSGTSFTYATHKDTMVMELLCTGFTSGTVFTAGEQCTLLASSRLCLSTRKIIVDDSGSAVPYSATLTENATVSGTGTVTLKLSGPAIYESGGQYNTVSAAPAAGAVVTMLGSASTTYQPNLFWHRDAFAIGSVPIKKLYSTDTLATTKDGLQFRVSKGSGFLENVNKVRIDFRPAYAVLNPFFAGHCYGTE